MTDAEMSLKVRTLAAICHEVNRVYCQSLGDFTQKRWTEAQKWQRESAIGGVKAHMRDPSLSGEGSHALWMKEKIAQGWTYGEVKDIENRRHPCLVEYSKLPESQRVKDYLFKAVIQGAREAASEQT